MACASDVKIICIEELYFTEHHKRWTDTNMYECENESTICNYIICDLRMFANSSSPQLPFSREITVNEFCICFLYSFLEVEASRKTDVL